MMRRCVHLILLLLAALGFGGTTQAQEARSFALTSCPQITGVDKAAFNSKYGSLTSLAEYLAVLRRTFPGDKGKGTVRYSMTLPSGDVRDLAFHIPSQKNGPAGLVSLSSKGTFYSTLESRADLRQWLRDTVAVWDTLRLRLRLIDADAANDRYFLIWTDPASGQSFKSSIPVMDGALVITASLFGTAPPNVIPVILRHEGLGKQKLATFSLCLIPADERADLLDHVCAIAGEQAIPAKDQHVLLHQCCEAWYGAIPPDQLPTPICAVDPQR